MQDYIFLETGEIVENMPSLEKAIERFSDLYAGTIEAQRISHFTVCTFDEYKKSMGE
jgi:hypothetical protein